MVQYLTLETTSMQLNQVLHYNHKGPCAARREMIVLDESESLDVSSSDH
jgi:hypothetical protein